MFFYLSKLLFLCYNTATKVLKKLCNCYFLGIFLPVSKLGILKFQVNFNRSKISKTGTEGCRPEANSHASIHRNYAGLTINYDRNRIGLVYQHGSVVWEHRSVVRRYKSKNSLSPHCHCRLLPSHLSKSHGTLYWDWNFVLLWVEIKWEIHEVIYYWKL